MSEAAFAAARRLLIEGGDGPAEDRLYASWFHGASEEVRDYPGPGAYCAAALDPARFEPGWRVAGGAEGMAAGVVAERGGRSRNVAPPECTPAEPCRLRLRPGDALLVDPLSQGVSGGFWHLWSAAWVEEAPKSLQRLYFAIEPGGELEFARRFAASADPADRWAVKILSGRHGGRRRDAAVAYFERDRPIDQGWTGGLPAMAADLVRGEAPALTRPVAPGIGWSEDPGGGISFGQHVCRLLAAAAARPGALAGEEDWTAAVAAEFSAHGLDARRPELCTPAGVAA